MILINAIVGLPSDVDVRIHIRNQLFAAGFQNALKHLQSLAKGNEYLRRQVETFETDMNDDWNEYRVRFSLSIQDLHDPVMIVQKLSEQCVKTDAFPYFVSLMQHLLAVRPHAQRMYFKLIDEIVTYVVLDQRGIDPDFGKGVHGLNFRALLETLKEKGTLSGTESEAAKQLEEIKAEKEALELELMEREEMSQTQWRLKEAEYQKIIESLRGGSQGFESSMQNDDTRLHAILCHLSQQNVDVNNPAAAAKITDDVVQELDKKVLVAELLRLRDQNVAIRTKSVISRNASYATLNPIPEATENCSSDSVFACPPPPPPPPNPLFLQNGEATESPSSGGVPPPPPPPLSALGLPLTKPKKEPLYQPSKKLKPFQWEKLPENQIQETIWNECDERELVKQIGEEKMLAAWKTMEDLFAVEPSPVESRASFSSDETKVVCEKGEGEKEKEVVREVSVIDAKRAYNLSKLTL